jgi:hypothetical protein
LIYFRNKVDRRALVSLRVLSNRGFPFFECCRVQIERLSGH